MTLTLVTEAAEEPVTLDEVKRHLALTGSDHDTYLGGLITAARRYIENITNRAFVTQTWKLSLDSLPQEIRIAKSPLATVSSLKYYDVDGDLQTLDSSVYQVDAEKEPARIRPAYGQVWPTVRCQMNAVQLECVVGYGDAEDVPAEVKHCIINLVAHWFEIREPVSDIRVMKVPFAFQALLDSIRVYRIV